MDETNTPAGTPHQRGAADRRTQPRYRFTASAEIADEKTGQRIEVHITDISERGCHAETTDPLPLGTETRIGITKGADSFAAQARVVYSSATGLGLAFSHVTAGQIPILEKWLGLSREQNWLALNRRRTQRVLMRVPVRVSAQAARFREETHTLAISAHGASVMLSRPVAKGERLEILNIATGDRGECVVACLGQRQGDHVEVGVEFILPNPKFWHVAFPPKDWTQPAAEP